VFAVVLFCLIELLPLNAQHHFRQEVPGHPRKKDERNGEVHAVHVGGVDPGHIRGWPQHVVNLYIVVLV
jgi:hypothetical protein